MKGHSRLQQVLDWVGGSEFDGCLVFDESHKSKNFMPGKEAQSTKVKQMLWLLNNMLIAITQLRCQTCQEAPACMTG